MVTEVGENFFMNNDIKKFFKNIFTWNNLIKFGYFDFQPGKNAKHQRNSNTDAMYGKTDFVNPDWFNFDKIVSNEEIMDYIQNNDYFYKDKKDKSKIHFLETTPIIFSIPKDKETRRVLKFPNFYSYCMLTSIIMAYKERIIDSLISDEHSLSKFFNRQPFDFDTSKRLQSNILVGYTHFYKTDFSNFYHTIYTHAIAWLVNGKNNAKWHREDSLLGNRLDHAVESVQNKETYGLPTGNLLTRIIVEYSMSFFDKRVKRKLGHNINFTRYVDDIYFGYNREEELEKIKKVMYDSSKKYNFILNPKKTGPVEFLDIKESSRLLYFFDDVSVKNMKAKDFAKLYNSFFQNAINEIKNDKKGTKILIFTSLRYFITRSGINSSTRREMIEGLVYVNGRNQKSFMDDLLQLVLLDSRLTLYFIQLIKVIKKEESKIKFKEGGLINFKIVSFHFSCEFKNQSFLNNIIRNLKFYVQNDNNQEAYTILSLFRLFNIHISLKDATSILRSTKVDDLNCVLLLDNLFSNISKENDISNVLSVLQRKIESNFPSEYFEDQHWLLKYELFYLYKHNEIIRKKIRNYYRLGKSNQYPENTQYMNYAAFKKETKSMPDENKKGINELKLMNSFYIKLLEHNISFVNLKSAYNSEDI